MKDSEKMGIVGTKLFWQLFTTSIHCRGVAESTLENHIQNYKLFMYWARIHNKKFMIRRMFFPVHMTPFIFLEEMLKDSKRLARYAREARGEENVIDFTWKGIFHSKLCYIQGLLDPCNKEDKFENPADVLRRVVEVETDWKIFFENAKHNLI